MLYTRVDIFSFSHDIINYIVFAFNAALACQTILVHFYLTLSCDLPSVSKEIFTHITRLMPNFAQRNFSYSVFYFSSRSLISSLAYQPLKIIVIARSSHFREM